MKWGRHTSSPSSVITRVFPSTWFSRFKQTKQQKGKLDFPTSGRREAKFYSLDNDPYWTLSFRKRKVVNLPPCDYEDDFQVAVSSFRSEVRSTHNSKIKRGECRIKAEGDCGLRKKKARIKRQRSRRRAEKRKVFPADQVKEEFEVSINRNQNINFHKHSLSSIKEDYEEEEDEDEDEDDVITDLDGKESTSSEASERVSNSQCQNLENNKFEGVKVKTRRRHCSRRIKEKYKKAHKIKKCRNQAVEEMENAKEQAEERSTIYNSYAVVKSSFNPQQDFKDSMVEMIEERGIRRREELEELLACYLTLNCDEHHDLIINAFHQVWLEINGGAND